jgi:long-chain acyl-CoA synthetase
LERPQVAKDSPVTIIYTSGTSGEAKGVVLTAANVGFMLDRTAERLEQLMSGATSVRRVRTASFIICRSRLRRRGLRC